MQRLIACVLLATDIGRHLRRTHDQGLAVMELDFGVLERILISHVLWQPNQYIPGRSRHRSRRTKVYATTVGVAIDNTTQELDVAGMSN